jgi:membrane protein YqaA with SNARE-associated domain
MLAPMVLARPERWWRNAALCTLGSVLGAVLGWAIGYGLEPVGRWILAMTGHAGGEAALRAGFAEWGVLVILGQGLLPVPYKLVTITSGLAHFPLWQLLLASCVTRSVRFFGVAFLVRRFGPALLPVIERRLLLVTTVVLVLAVAAFAAWKLLHP